jgi:hypothetical protein
VLAWSQAHFSIFGEAEEGWRRAVKTLHACPNTVRIFWQVPKVRILQEVQGSGLPAIPSDHSWVTDSRLVYHAAGTNKSLGSKRWDGDARAHNETISSCSGTMTELGFAWNGSMVGWSSFTPTNIASWTSSCDLST